MRSLYPGLLLPGCFPCFERNCQMFRDQELFHGAAFARLLRRSGRATVTPAEAHPSAYLIEVGDSAVTVLFKVNRVRRKSPWQFTFTATEADALTGLENSFPSHRRFVALICRLDGVCCLTEEQVLFVLGGELAGRAITVRRPRDGSYRVSGPDRRKLKETIPQNAWPCALFASGND